MDSVHHTDKRGQDRNIDKGFGQMFKAMLVGLGAVMFLKALAVALAAAA